MPTMHILDRWQLSISVIFSDHLVVGIPVEKARSDLIDPEGTF